jgi:hypothetical protein
MEGCFVTQEKPFITFLHAGGELDAPANARRGELVGEWWPESAVLPAVGDVVVLDDGKNWRVRVRVLHRADCARVLATLHVAPVGGQP